MEKIISLYQRNYDTDRLVRDEVVPGAEWVLNGGGVATRKWDGTCCLFKDGKYYKRYDVKRGKAPPGEFIPAQEPDPITGHWPGWLPVVLTPDNRWHLEAWEAGGKNFPDGTYELCGPKVNDNQEELDKHVLIPHGKDILEDAPRDFNGLKAYFESHNIEGIVWWHPDGRKVKIKAKDFGIKRKTDWTKEQTNGTNL